MEKKRKEVLGKVMYLALENWRVKKIPAEECYNFFLLSLLENFITIIKLPNDKEYVGIDGVVKEDLEEAKEIFSKELKEYNFDIIEIDGKPFGIFSDRK